MDLEGPSLGRELWQFNANGADTDTSFSSQDSSHTKTTVPI